MQDRPPFAYESVCRLDYEKPVAVDAWETRCERFEKLAGKEEKRER